MITSDQQATRISPLRPAEKSRLRSLVRDACRCLHQQMVFWGCDARYREGNQLEAFGLERHARAEAMGEGSSRYRGDWQGGTVELHSFCAGWYPRDGTGVLFIRNRERLYACSVDQPIEPGAYDGTVHGATPDDMLPLCQPMMEWIANYERWLRARVGPAYRHECWMRHLSRMGARPWLAPEQALEWMERFIADPASAPRARELIGKSQRSHFAPSRVRRTAASRGVSSPTSI